MVLREYIVTLKNKNASETFYSQMESEGSFEFIPSREVQCVHKRSISRNTHYLITEDEAVALRLDPRVEAVELAPHNLGLKIEPHSSQTATFSRKELIAEAQKNWALYRCSLRENIAGWGESGLNADQTGTIKFNTDGSNVDVVVVDEILYPDHSEFNGRAVQYNWFGNHDSDVRGTGCDIVRIERSASVARITTKTAHGLNTGNKINVTCITNGSFDVTDATIIDVSATPVGSGGDGVTINRFRYANTGSTVLVTTKTISTVARDSSNIATVVTSGAHGLTTGMTVGVSVTAGATGFTAAPVVVTRVNDTTFTYPNTGSVVTTTSVTGTVYVDDAQGTWVGVYLYNSYTSNNNHATAVGGVIAGETQGWARGSNIYNLRHDTSGSPASQYTPLGYVIDYLRYWHANKSINVTTGVKNPTVANCSWGLSVGLNNRNNYTGNNKTKISQLNYRGSVIKAEDIGSTVTDTGFSGVCNASAVFGDLRGSSVGSTTASATISTITNVFTGSGSVAAANLTGTIRQGDYLVTNISGWPAGCRITSVSIDTDPVTFNFTFLRSVSVTGTSTATCTFYSADLKNKAYSITTTGTPTATVTPITLALVGNASLTDQGAPDAVSANSVDIYDDAGWECTLPFDINYLGVDYGPTVGSSSAFINVSTNSFVTFGSGLGNTYTYQPDPAGPPVRKICISAGDRSARKCYVGTTGSTPNRQFRIRYEGHDGANGSVEGSPTVVWEMVFFENAPTTVELHVGDNAVVRGEFTAEQLIDYGVDLSSNTAPQRNAGLDADIADAIAEGIIFVGSAGNQNFKIDLPTGNDYDNYYLDNGIPYYYHRGSSPGAATGVICVGGLSSGSGEGRSQNSNTGPRVDLYAPGVNVISSVYDNQGPGLNGASGVVGDGSGAFAISTVGRSANVASIVTATAHGITTGDLVTVEVSGATSTTFNTSMTAATRISATEFSYSNTGTDVGAGTGATGTVSPGYFYQKYTGTSIAAAQVSGVLAIALETYPELTSAQAKEYITRYAMPGLMADTEGSYNDPSSLQGGANKILYFYKERPTEGPTFPKLNYQIRPTSGPIFPRTKIRRT
jgi:hypothetical protein